MDSYNRINERFQNFTKGKKLMNREQFCEKMGILGLETSLFLSQRIFKMLDQNNDGHLISYCSLFNYMLL